jgi:anti-sigma regulatory factor (Ser/Thr protein kinase)
MLCAASVSGQAALMPPSRARQGKGVSTVLDAEFGAGTLSDLRAAVLEGAAKAGLPDGRAIDVMLALHELAANVVRHGAGRGRLRMDVTERALRCQVSDAGAAGEEIELAEGEEGAAGGSPVSAASARQSVAGGRGGRPASANSAGDPVAGKPVVGEPVVGEPAPGTPVAGTVSNAPTTSIGAVEHAIDPPRPVDQGGEFREPPAWPVRHGHGLWLVRNTADQVQVRTGPAGSVVEVVFTLPG